MKYNGKEEIGAEMVQKPQRTQKLPLCTISRISLGISCSDPSHIHILALLSVDPDWSSSDPYLDFHLLVQYGSVVNLIELMINIGQWLWGLEMAACWNEGWDGIVKEDGTAIIKYVVMPKIPVVKLICWVHDRNMPGLIFLTHILFQFTITLGLEQYKYICDLYMHDRHTYTYMCTYTHVYMCMQHWSA